MNLYFNQNVLESPKTTSVVERRPRKQVRERQSIELAAYEWKLLVSDAAELGLSPSKFIVLLWRNWKQERWTLKLIAPLPVEPWRGDEK